MPTLDVTARRFTGAFARVNGTHLIRVSKRRCMKFAASIGMPLLHAGSPSSRHAVALSGYKAMAIKCAVDFSSTALERPVEYEGMEKSEKANISFWTGMVFAAIAADELLRVPRLIHAKSVHRPLVLENARSKSLADLVGQDRVGSWHVIEAKARQQSPSEEDRRKWKTQARTIRAIGGTPPQTRSYALTRVTDRYSLEIVDPPPEGGSEGIDLPITPEALLRKYYEPLLLWLREGAVEKQRDGVVLVTKPFVFDAAEGELVHLGLRVRPQNLWVGGGWRTAVG